MSPQVREADLRRFAAVGFPAPVRAADNPNPQRLAESAARALENPSARLVKAVSCALEDLAVSNRLHVFSSVEFSEDVRRRLGYLAERRAQDYGLDSSVAQRLASFGATLREPGDSEKPPLTLMAKTNPTLLRLQAERGDRINEKWNVLDV